MGDLEFRHWAKRLTQTGVEGLSALDRHALERLLERVGHTQAKRIATLHDGQH